VSDALDGVELDLAGPPGPSIDLEIPDGADMDPLYLAFLGLWSLVLGASELSDDERERRLGELVVRLQGREGPLRFELFEISRRHEVLERAGRIVAGESRLKRGWLVPKLEAEIEAYRARIEALRAALEVA